MSRAQTVTVPSINAIAGTVGPAILARSSNTPQRALIKNSGGNVVLIGFSAQAVSDVNSSTDSFRLDPGESQVFVLEPSDQIYAAAIGANGLISAHVSPAFPLGTWSGS